MIFADYGGIVLGKFHIFSAEAQIAHFVSTRGGGFSQGSCESLNLSLHVEDPHAIQNREALAGALAMPHHRLIFPTQCHSDQVVLVDATTDAEDLAGVDALITVTPGICIAVVVADCVPVLIFNPKKKVAAVAHAGWRGTVKKVLSKTIRKMKTDLGCDPAANLVAIGPSISVKRYEVGEEVAQSVKETLGDREDLIRKNETAGKYLFDLSHANKLQAIEEGVPKTQIEIAGICTFSNPGLFFSARRQGQRSGRFGAGIMLL